MSEHVFVYLLSGDPDSERVDKLSRAFDHPLFDLKIVNISYPYDDEEYGDDYDKRAAEMYRFRWCLKHSQERDPNAYVLVIKDTSVSHVSSDQLANIVNVACTKNGKTPQDSWHLFYLCKWNDRCDMYDNKSGPSVDGTQMVRSYSPHGLQSIIFSPYGRDVIVGKKNLLNGDKFTYHRGDSLGATLNKCILDKQINAFTTTTNVFNYDPVVAENTGDLFKLNSCDTYPIDDNHHDNSRFSPAMFAVAVIIIAFVIIILIALAKRR